MKTPEYTTELIQDPNTYVLGLVVWLDTQSIKEAKTRVSQIVKQFNSQNKVKKMKRVKG